MNAIKSYYNDVKHASKNAKLFIITNVLYGILLGATWTGLGIVIEDSFSPAVLGTAFAMHTLGMAVASVPVGAGANKFGYKPVLMTGTIIGALCLILNGFVSNVAILYVLNFVFGLSQGVYEVLPAPCITANTKDKERSSVMSVMFGLYWLAVVIITKTSGNFIEFFQSQFNVTEIIAYKYYTFAAAIIGLLGIFSILAMDEIKDEARINMESKKSSFIEDFKMVANKEVILYLVYMGLIGLGAGLFCPFFANFFKNGLNLDPTTVGNVLSVQYFAMVIGMFICPLLVKKLGRVITLGGASLASVPFMLIIVNSDQFGAAMVPALTIAFFMRSGLMNLAMPVMYSLPLDFVKDNQRAPLAGVISLFSSGTRALSSFIAGYIMAIPAFNVGKFIIDGYRIPYYIAGVLYTIGTIVLIKTYIKKYNKTSEDNIEAKEAVA
jgi:MFS family permease